MIRVEGLAKNFGGFQAVKGVSFTANEGEIFGIAGPNGAGKSTIVKMLSTILSPSSGEAEINGLDIRRDAQEIRRIIGYLPEEPRVYDYLSGRSFLRFFANIYGIRDTDRRIQEMLKFVGLLEHAGRKIGDYSKGMKQRISIARALLHDPEVLILDEPTMGLDPASARELREKVLGLRDEGKTILICTHYMDEADFLCDKLAILNQGKIAAIGKPEALKARVGKKRYVSVVLEETAGDRERKFVRLLKARQRGRAILVEAADTGLAIKRIHDASKACGVRMLSIRNVEPSLDDAFIEFTRGH
ncbi:MAG TPA: ABC transporter ATP-binding protein [Candidatus Norongarragalinales archaeon]|nr:ABC transporter ATP-binding protein [Candidatus Norongarragalinales archaeon]